MKFEMIPADQIRPAPWQPRDSFPKETIESLSASLGAVGMIQPIVVRKKGETYQIIAGERRWRAWKDEFGKIPCILREEDDTDAKVTSVIENWQREAVGEAQNEKFLAQLYEEGSKKQKWNSINEMSKRTGIPHGTLNEIITAHKEKKELKVAELSNLSYHDVAVTRQLREEPEIRKELLTRRAEGKLTQDELSEYAKTLKEAPKPLKKAILDGKVDFEDAKALIKHGIPEKMGKSVAEELEERKTKRERLRELDIEKDKAVLSKKIKLIEVSVELSADEIRFREFEQIAIQVRGWRAFHFDKIKEDKWRNAAIRQVRQIRDACDALLMKLEAR